jgi:hypothetical protein
MGQHLVVVRRIDEAAGLAELDDLASVPIAIDLKTLATARSRVKSQKHRVAAIRPPARPMDLRAMVKAGLTPCAQGLVKQRMQNFTLEAYRIWADRLHGDTTKESWAKMFPPGRNLWRGLTSIYQFTENWGGRSLRRGIFAEFLDEAGNAVRAPELTALSARYRDIARGWSDLASAALPDDLPSTREARQLYDRLSTTYRARGADATPELTAAWNRLEELASASQRFPMSADRIEALRLSLKERVLDLHRAETSAREEMVVAAAAL